ncbi:flagellar motor rotation isoform A [Chlorella sorokiniana]|uniref:Flagellar motor rotation isoform A n=1 Tax=Chlorella sorokiniana TaxID=3076 RepID=A0A2P6TNE2_CHLSO|nr:flagellar motor rotation isoform A [Chlorella sorokiniana]|eukprot:PRW50856.1 flagellar motor rotation isoform A [Chlorella sorokiniana]
MTRPASLLLALSAALILAEVTDYEVKAVQGAVTITPPVDKWRRREDGAVALSFPASAFVGKPAGDYVFTATAINADGTGPECSPGVTWELVRPSTPQVLNVTWNCERVLIQVAKLSSGTVPFTGFELGISGNAAWTLPPFSMGWAIPDQVLNLRFAIGALPTGTSQYTLTARSWFGNGGTSQLFNITRTPCDWQLANLRNQLAQTEKDLQTCTASLANKTSTINTLQQDKTQLTANLQTCNSNLANKTSTINTLQQDKTQLTADLQTCNANKATLNTNLTTCDTNLTSTKTELDTLFNSACVPVDGQKYSLMTKVESGPFLIDNPVTIFWKTNYTSYTMPATMGPYKSAGSLAKLHLFTTIEPCNDFGFTPGQMIQAQLRFTCDPSACTMAGGNMTIPGTCVREYAVKAAWACKV